MSFPVGQTVEVPLSGLRFSAPVTLAAASAEQGARGRRFSGVAYSGNVITDHGWWDAVAFDLTGVSATAPMPLLLQHDQDRQIGVIDSFVNDGRQIAIGGKLFTGIDAAADAVAAKADAGAPWQMSVGIFPDKIETLRPVESAVVNGRPVPGGTTIFRTARVREVSFVALGADSGTHALVFGASGGMHVAQLVTPKEPLMSDTNLAAQLAAMTAERDAAVARATAADAKLAEITEQFAASQRAGRETAVKELLGEDFSAEKAAPYMGMSAEQFGAVQSAIGAMRSKLPAQFTTEIATGGGGTAGQGESPLVASARQMFGIK